MSNDAMTNPFTDEEANNKTVNELWDAGYAVVVFSIRELRGADPESVQDWMTASGWDSIEMLATEPMEDAE